MKIIITVVLLLAAQGAGAQILAVCTNHTFPETCSWNVELRAWECDKPYPKHDGVPYDALETLQVVKYIDGSIDATETREEWDKINPTFSALAWMAPAAICSGPLVNCEAPDRSRGLYVVKYVSDGPYFALEQRIGTHRYQISYYQTCN
jgi:hypothetical protein